MRLFVDFVARLGLRWLRCLRCYFAVTLLRCDLILLVRYDLPHVYVWIDFAFYVTFVVVVCSFVTLLPRLLDFLFTVFRSHLVPTRVTLRYVDYVLRVVTARCYVTLIRVTLLFHTLLLITLIALPLFCVTVTFAFVCVTRLLRFALRLRSVVTLFTLIVTFTCHAFTVDLICAIPLIVDLRCVDYVVTLRLLRPLLIVYGYGYVYVHVTLHITIWLRLIYVIPR